MITESDFVEIILKFQRAAGRHDLPWQHPASPYRVLVSEIMLQQTQVTTVIPYFERWMQSFPTLEHLANASEDEVMAHWQGLGYYARARNLQKASRFLINHYQGNFPDDLQELQKIPGVGRYTAGAIRSFAFNEWGPIVDGNVRRLFCRLFAIEGLPTAAKVDKELWRLAEHYTPVHDNRAFAQGLLDMGSTLCKPQNPECDRCPLQSHCIAFRENRQHELPTKRVKKALPTKHAHFSLCYENGSIMLEKRPAAGLWSALWMLPEIEKPTNQASAKFEFAHTFTHFKMKGNVWLAKCEHSEIRESVTTQQVRIEELAHFGVPTPLKKHIDSWLNELEQDK
ncbi:MAG: A/G-specific adenine glycosylase [Idiomarinaceae bacterium HL-53]|nr:MAG: A/G-specific adenine glycosylase [Idiomarinaceae bacterium HL-53]CUS48484.1 A/G-specific DNA-adenine glycosylase [Idiomarinaceae bacterium HL-53]